MQKFASFNVCVSVTYIKWSSVFDFLFWRLFDGWMLCWRYWFSVTQKLTLDYICRSVTYISWSGEFALYLETYLVDKWVLDLCDAKIYHIKCMWDSDLHFMVQWFCHILKTFWWKNVVLKILFDMGHWPVFHDLAILNHLPVSAFSGLLIWKYLWI